MAPQLATVDVTLNVHFMAGQCSAPPSDLSKELFSSTKKRDHQPQRQRITDISFSFSLITSPLAQVVILIRPSKKKKKKKKSRFSNKDVTFLHTFTYPVNRDYFYKLNSTVIYHQSKRKQWLEVPHNSSVL